MEQKFQCSLQLSAPVLKYVNNNKKNEIRQIGTHTNTHAQKKRNRHEVLFYSTVYTKNTEIKQHPGAQLQSRKPNNPPITKLASCCFARSLSSYCTSMEHGEIALRLQIVVNSSAVIVLCPHPGLPLVSRLPSPSKRVRQEPLLCEKPILWTIHYTVLVKSDSNVSYSFLMQSLGLQNWTARHKKCHPLSPRCFFNGQMPKLVLYSRQAMHAM